MVRYGLRNQIVKWGLVAVMAAVAPVGWAVAAPKSLQLSGDFLSMAPVGGAPVRLAVFTADRAKADVGGRKRHQRRVSYFAKQGDSLALLAASPVPDDAGGFDVCPGVEAGKEQILFVRPDGVYAQGRSEPLATGASVLAHARDDALPRVRLCFALFKGEGAALVVPSLRGVAVYRQQQPGKYALHAELAAEANQRLQWPMLRGPDTVQRVGMSLQFPDVTAPDMNGDGRADLCFNLGPSLACYSQDPARGFAGAAPRRHAWEVLSDDEEKDRRLLRRGPCGRRSAPRRDHACIRVESRLVELNGDGKPDMVLAKTNWNVASMNTELAFYLQKADGSFAPKPSQILQRQGYFAYQDYVDFDGDGRLDLLAPVTPLGWSDLARIYLTKAADLAFVWYRNTGGTFSESAQEIHAMTFPVDFKNMAALLGALPLWNLSFLPPKQPAERQMLFLPGRSALEIRGQDAQGKAGGVLWSASAKVGSDILALDLDQDGRSEVVSGYPRDPQRANVLLYVAPPSS